MMGFLKVLAFLTVVGLYFLPFIVGMKKKNASAIFAMNLFLGWSIIGWIVAFVWACTKDNGDHNPDLIKCPRCAEQVRKEALVCRFCGCELLGVKK